MIPVPQGDPTMRLAEARVRRRPDPPTKTEIIHQIRRTLALFHQPGDTVETRVVGIPSLRGKPHNAAGYFRDFDAAAEAAAEYEMKRRPAAIYFVMNRCDPALYARSPDCITDYLEQTTTDHDIKRRRWLLVDVDPTRPAGIGSTDEQLAAAYAVAESIREWLMERGWPEPIIAMSGNGYHLLFPINLPNNKRSAAMISGILKALDAQFSAKRDADEEQDAEEDGQILIGIHMTVFNAARITKLYGTMVRKGHSTAEQPHRRSEIIYVPDYLDVQQEVAV